MRLYHFLESKHALADLSHRRLKIAEYSDLNDPFELTAVDTRDATQRLAVRRWRRGFQEKWGLLCFCKTWRNPLMWSHYADKHRGMCLGFDVDDNFIIPVKYSPSRLDISFIDSKGEVALNKQTMLRVLQTKFSGWGYEQEVRLSAQLQESDSDSGLYYYKFDERVRLAELIAGPLSIDTKEDILSALADGDAKIEISKSRLAFKSFRVVKDKRGVDNLNAV